MITITKNYDLGLPSEGQMEYARKYDLPIMLSRVYSSEKYSQGYYLRLTIDVTDVPQDDDESYEEELEDAGLSGHHECDGDHNWGFAGDKEDADRVLRAWADEIREAYPSVTVMVERQP